jgi:hypothetical protein
MKSLRGSVRRSAARAHTYCTPIAENRVVEPQLTCVHDAICFFVAFSLTDFVTCGFASCFFTLATSSKNAVPGFFSLGTGSPQPYRYLNSLLFHNFSGRNLPVPVSSVSWATSSQNAPLPGSHTARRGGDRRLLPQR